MPTKDGQAISGRENRTSSALSVTACLRCRDQKLKCGREHPMCSRCSRLKAACLYPDPPNRRGPRNKRCQGFPAAGRGRRIIHDGHRATQHSCNVYPLEEASAIGSRPLGVHPRVENPTPSRHSPIQDTREDARSISRAWTPGANPKALDEPLVLSDSYSAQLRRMQTTVKHTTSDSEQRPLPPTSLGLSLLEIYFTRIYNASLMFCKPLLFREYLEGKVHSTLLKALFALATLFLIPTQNNNENARGDSNELDVLSIYQPYGLNWAKAASADATLLAMESPSVMIIQALQCIQLYWFGIGRPQAGNLCLALAYRSCQTFGFGKKMELGSGNPDKSIEHELGRRCFWACWTSTCIVMEPEPFIESAWKEAAMLPLPRPFTAVSLPREASFNQMMDENWDSLPVLSSTVEYHPPTAEGILIKIVGVWAKVQLLRKNRSPTEAATVRSIYDLSSLATSLFETASSTRTSAYLGDNSPTLQMTFLLHDAIYHQAQITLHSMVVPLFSGVPTNEQIQPETQKRSAETVIRHADQFEALLRPYLYTRDDVSGLPALVGYGAFVVGIVFLSTELCWNNRSGGEIRTGVQRESRRLDAVRAILRLLETLKSYWTALKIPCEKLDAALQKSRSTSTDSPGLDDLVSFQPSTNYREPHRPTTSREPIQPHESTDRYQQPPLEHSIVRGLEGGGTAVTGFHHTEETHADGEIIPSGSLIDQLDMLPCDEWYGLSLAEAGVDELADLELANLFRQGYGAFS